MSANIEHDQKVTPWEVEGAVVNGETVGIDYQKLIDQFGCQALSEELIQRFEKLTGQKAHHFLRRGVFFAHRDFAKLLDFYEQGKPIYLYTGRGPSSESMHLGHMVPFIFCKYLQDVFDCHLVIQMTDDEKFLFKENLKLEETTHYGYENAKDIIAVGFNPKKTFIFLNTQYMGFMFEEVLKIQKLINYNQARSVFGFSESDAVGKIAYPMSQIAPAFPSAFRHLFGNNNDVMCLIPCAIDQDPYFRLARDIAPRLKFHKPAELCSTFFPALQGFGTKMSASLENTAIFMTDTPASIKNKINKYAFSGGKETVEEHRKLGGNPDVDVSFQYLRFFLTDSEELSQIEKAYRSGELLTGDLKKRCIEVLQKFVTDFQEKRQNVTQETLDLFFKLPLTPREKQMQEQIDALLAGNFATKSL